MKTPIFDQRKHFSPRAKRPSGCSSSPKAGSLEHSIGGLKQLSQKKCLLVALICLRTSVFTFKAQKQKRKVFAEIGILRLSPVRAWFFGGFGLKENHLPPPSEVLFQMAPCKRVAMKSRLCKTTPKESHEMMRLFITRYFKEHAKETL